MPHLYRIKSDQVEKTTNLTINALFAPRALEIPDYKHKK
jgi:hypothetical protein